MSILINATEGEMPDDVFTTVDGLFEKWLSRNGKEEFRAQCALHRNDFVMNEARPSYYAGEYHFKVAIYPKGDGHRTYSDSGKMTLTPSPSAVEGTLLPGHYLDVVTTNPALVYRGMAFEEWQFIQDHGYVESLGAGNIGQKGLTLWGAEYSTAAYYANGFAPWPFKPGAGLPGVVIAIPQELALKPADHSEIPDGERATQGRLDAALIQHVWLLNPTEITSGFYDFETAKTLRRPTLESGSASAPDVSVVASQLK